MTPPMTAGQRAVWAAEFVRSAAAGLGDAAAAELAAAAVQRLAALRDAGQLTGDVRAMLDDMLGGGPADRPGLRCADGEVGEFAHEGGNCKRCGAPGWKHWTLQPRGGR